MIVLRPLKSNYYDCSEFIEFLNMKQKVNIASVMQNGHKVAKTVQHVAKKVYRMPIRSCKLQTHKYSALTDPLDSSNAITLSYMQNALISY